MGWRTKLDVVRDLARSFLRGEKTLDQLEADWPLIFAMRDLAEEELGLDDGMGQEDAVIETIRRFADGLSSYEVYPFDGDTQFGDAADALDLPSWAYRLDVDDGGMGCGFVNAQVVVEHPHTFDDLYRWLEKRCRQDAAVE